MEVLRAAGWWAAPDGAPNQYREHFRCTDLSVGTYCIPGGGKDGQDPHTEDLTVLAVFGPAERSRG